MLKARATQNQEFGEMRQMINEEMKDMKSANCQFGFELERNQNLFRQMQSELLLTMEEKKQQNDTILEGVVN